MGQAHDIADLFQKPVTSVLMHQSALSPLSPSCIYEVWPHGSDPRRCPWSKHKSREV